jgi:hypothetical protein
LTAVFYQQAPSYQNKMASFEEQVQQAVDARDIPGVILLAGDAKGNPAHSGNQMVQLISSSRHVQIRKGFRA